MRKKQRLTICPLKSPAALSRWEGEPATRAVVGQSAIRDLERIPQRDLAVGRVYARGIDHVGERHQLWRPNEAEGMVNDADGVRVELVAAFLFAASLVDSDGRGILALVET